MNSPQELPPSDRSISTSTSSGYRWHRMLWVASLLTMASLLAMHAALAHSPDLVRFLPDQLLSAPPSCSAHSVLTPGQCAGEVLPPPVYSGCRTSGHIEPPILTDTLYEEVDRPDARSPDDPADALKCLPPDEAQDGTTLTDRHA